jgi:DNA polymerase-3 subunit epsilon
MPDIVNFDLETTGTSIVNDRIVEICAIKYDSETLAEKLSVTVRINPGMPIPKGASDVHGIKDEDVKDKPMFKAYAQGIYDFFNGCILMGYNITRFDVPLLYEELARCNLYLDISNIKVIDCCHIYHQKEPRDLTAALKFYTGRTMENAHHAESDVKACFDIMIGQNLEYGIEINDMIKMCERDPKSLDFEGKIILNENNEAIFNFGKSKGRRVVDDVNYAYWMLKGEFSSYTKAIIKNILNANNL